jgi:FAD/FMN-containing dehydrogenase
VQPVSIIMLLNLLTATWVLPSVLGLAIMSSNPAPVTRATDLRQAGTNLAKTLSKKATVTFPSDSRWEALLTRGSYPRLSPDYSVVIEVGDESDVQKTLAYAKKNSIPFLAVSGAHAWTDTINRLPYGFQVRMRQLNSTVVNAGGKTATIGGGALQYEVVRDLFAKKKQAGKTFPFVCTIRNLP